MSRFQGRTELYIKDGDEFKQLEAFVNEYDEENELSIDGCRKCIGTESYHKNG